MCFISLSVSSQDGLQNPSSPVDMKADGVGTRPRTRRPLSWRRAPLATRPFGTGDDAMAPSDPSQDSCRHNRAPLRRLGKIVHERTGKCVYVLLCTECGFTVTTNQLRRLRLESFSGREPVEVREPIWGSVGGGLFGS